MKNQLIKNLKNKRVFVISPHFDDAVLSCGMLLHDLQGKAQVTVVNVFTKAHGKPYTLSQKKFLKDAGFRDARALYKHREKTDITALNLVGAKHINLGLIDALFRTKKKKNGIGKFIPEMNHMYPTYHWHLIKKVSREDDSEKLLKKKLSRIVKKNAVVIVPSGIGNHADHVIVRNACKDLFPNAIFYVDFPYTIRLKDFGKSPNGYKSTFIDTNLSVKQKLIEAYTSQINGLFENGIVPKHQEKFFIRQAQI